MVCYRKAAVDFPQWLQALSLTLHGSCLPNDLSTIDNFGPPRAHATARVSSPYMQRLQIWPYWHHAAVAQHACSGSCPVYMYMQVDVCLRRTLCASLEGPQWLSELCVPWSVVTFQRLQRLDAPFLRMLMRRMPSTCSAYRLSRLPLACAHNMMSLHSRGTIVGTSTTSRRRSKAQRGRTTSAEER